MPKPKIKVCGMRDHNNLRDVVNLRPDFVGFIFYRKSLRFVGDEVLLPPTQEVRGVGVFVDEQLDKIVALTKKHDLKFVQLHGDESAELCEQLRKAGLKVIKVIRVETEEDILKANDYSDSADYLMFETKSASYGGSGRSFNWKLLEQYDGKLPYFLTGGLSLENLEQALELSQHDSRLYALDFNSGIEQSPGTKDIEKLEEVMKFISSYEIQR